MTSEKTIKRILFDESKLLYIFLMLIFLAGQIGIFFLSNLLASLYTYFSLLFFSIYLFFISLKVQYNYKLNPKFHILLIGFFGFLLISLQFSDAILVILVLLFAIALSLFTLVPLSSFAYTVECEYNLSNGRLTLRYNKLFLTIVQDYVVPRGSQINLHSLTKSSFIKKAMFHSISLNIEDRIYIAPLNVNGFSLINKLLQLLEPGSLRIDTITKTNSQMVFPKTNNVSLNIPKVGIPPPFYSIDHLPTLMSKNSFKTSFPKSGLKAKITSFILTAFIFFLPLVIITLIILSFLGLIEPVPIPILIYLVFMIMILLIIGPIIALNLIAVVFGKFDCIIEEEFIVLKYNFRNIKTVERRIHKAFNPLIGIEQNTIFLVILGDKTDNFYQHRIGKISDDDLMI